MASACSNEDDAPPATNMGKVDSVRVESFGVKYLFSDSARVTAQMYASQAREVEVDTEVDRVKSVVHYLDDSVHLEFLDAYGRAHSDIFADRGIYDRRVELAELNGNVLLKNNKGEQLETEQLFWDRNKDSVYTFKFVKITTPDKVITGDGGLRSNTSFTQYTIFGTRGEFELGEELN